MKSIGIRRWLPAFLVAMVIAAARGSLVQTKYKLAAHAGIGADIEPVRVNATLRDLRSGFFLTLGGYVVAPAPPVASPRRDP